MAVMQAARRRGDLVLLTGFIALIVIAQVFHVTVLGRVAFTVGWLTLWAAWTWLKIQAVKRQENT